MNFQLKSLTALLSAGALVLGLAACDGDDPDPPDPTDPDFDAVYDTTGTEITVADQGLGVAPSVDDVTWESDYTYILDGYAFVNDGQTLTIQPGTVVKGLPGQEADASALIVARGGTIMADGTASDPIIFTAEADDLSGSLGIEQGLWGGVIILGHASINTGAGVGNVEGIPTSETRGRYGCGDDFDCDDNDNSGVFRYVSIRHGGVSIGANNEINGLTLGAVGSGTTVEYVEVFANLDDGIEWFGGTANTKYMAVGFNGDDLFDYDEGWRGNNQFWFGIHPADDGGNLGEHDGGTDPEDGQPYATPTIYNATLVSSGASSGNGNGINLRDNAGGFYYNSILTEADGYAVSVEDLDSGEDSRLRLEGGDLELRNNLIGNFGVGTNPSDLFLSSTDPAEDNAWLVDYMTHADQDNVIADPMLTLICWAAGCGLDPTPGGSSPALSMDLATYSGGFFTSVNYAGAFAPGENWLAGWTAIDEFFGN